MTSKSDSEFTGIRSFLWPVHRHEIKKIIPMLVMLGLICFNYSILRNLKDAVVITAKSSGAEVIPFIKVWILLPMAILFTYLFTRLSSRLGQDKVFYITVSFFLFIYSLFVFVLYPIRDTIHPHETADWLQHILPGGCMGLIAMFRNWSFTLFYVMCELWGTMVLSVLFWSFANEVTKIGEARRFYSVLGIGANLSTIVAGQISNSLHFDHYLPWLPLGADEWEQSMIVIMFLMVVSGACIMGAFYWMNKHVLNTLEYRAFHAHLDDKPRKRKLSLKESFSYLSNSKYLLCIAALVVSYNLVINLVEVIWKGQLGVLYPSPKDYNIYMNNLTSLMGVFSTFAALFMARTISRFGWTKTALLTPLIMLVTSMGFFIFYFLQDNLGDAFTTMVGMTPLAIACFFGSTQNCLSKAAKYSLFDTTKEMTFIPLDHDEKLRGKAAIDGVGSRLGKSGGSVIHQSLLMFLGSFTATAPYIAGFILGVIALWMGAVRSLGKQFTNLVAEKDAKAYQELSDETAAEEQVAVSS